MPKFGIYNTLQKEWQFPSIAESTRDLAWKKLFKLIGHDARKWRFEIREIKL